MNNMRRKKYIHVLLCLCTVITMICIAQFCTNGRNMAIYHIGPKMAEVVLPAILRYTNNNIKGNENCPYKQLYPRTKLNVYEGAITEWNGLNSKQKSATPRNIQPLWINPKMRLNPEKYLLVIPRGGPNNQMYELREALFIAIKLNRTIVMPKFFKHFTDSQATGHRNTYIHPSHRLDVENFSKFASCITIDQFAETCGFKVDAVIQMRNYSKEDLKIQEKYMRMPLPRDGEYLSQSVAIPKGKMQNYIVTDEINEIFETDARCLVFPYPLFNLRIRASKTEKKGKNKKYKFSQSLVNLEDSPDVLLMKEIIKLTRNPTYIANMAKEYISKSIFKGRPFISVHWRYEELDFMNRCRFDLKKGNLSKARKKFCEKTLGVSGSDIADIVLKKILSIRNETNVRDIYIASPPSEREKIANTSRILFESHKFNTLSSPDLEAFITEHHGSCGNIMKHFNDILSTTEMEICSKGIVFLSSATSTWSLNVKHLRLTSDAKNLLCQYDEPMYS
ncbi:uncharacterized protein LOC120341462 isoform X1 [Styela clava]